VRIINLH